VVDHDRRRAVPRLQLRIGVTNTGHAHPHVVAAIQQQAARLLHGQQNIVFHEAGLEAHRRLAETAPAAGWGAFLSNSGAEAIEAAVKLARVTTGRPAVLAFRGGFHGRTAQAMALTTSRVTVRGEYEPLPGGVYHAAYPYCYRAPGRAHDPGACTCDWEAQLERMFAEVVLPSRVAAVIIEPVIGEGGYIVPPPGSCRDSARSPASTASCWSLTRCRRGSDGQASSSPSATGASCPT
jgi:4-aminobutyrate aminotransferase